MRAGEYTRATAAAGVAIAFVAVVLVAYEPAMDSGFQNDDQQVIVHNPYVQELSRENLRSILRPDSPAVVHASNYEPVHLLLQAVALHAFGPESIRAHHVTNALLHATAALLFVLLLASSRLPLPLAIGAGAVFLTHPANGEAVIFLYQAKTLLCTVFAFGALLAFWRFPALATALFLLALLSKITAAFALPTAAALLWARAGEPNRRVPHWGWLAAWTAVFVAVAIPELAVFRRTGEATLAMGADWIEQGRSIVAIAMRYLVIAATGSGVSALHQPEPARSWLDPWWLSGLATLALLGWRTLLTLRRREEEAAYWIMAAASFAPVSQVFPFLYPMADRYLYDILPGLIGATLLAAHRLAIGLEPRPKLIASRAAAAALAAAAVAFAVRTHDRADTLASPEAQKAEAARNYPNGNMALVLEAERAGEKRDAPAAAAAIAELHRRGYSSYVALAAAPKLQPVMNDPRVRASMDEIASYWVRRMRALEDPFQIDLLVLAQAHLVQRQFSEAASAAQRGLAIGGPHDAELRRVLSEAQAAGRLLGKGRARPRSQPRRR